jgi:CRP-like cAMP-binding protein
MTTLPRAPVLIGAAGHTLFHAGERGPAWRLIGGVLRIDRVAGGARQLMWLALPGDLVGAESLCDQPYQYDARGLTRVQLEPVHAPEAAAREAWLRQAVMQQQYRCQDMAALRTDQVTARLMHLLTLLGHDWREAQGRDPAARARADRIRAALPPLRELAEVVGAQHETVCRALARLLPPRSRSAGGGRRTSRASDPLAQVMGAAVPTGLFGGGA